MKKTAGPSNPVSSTDSGITADPGSRSSRSKAVIVFLAVAAALLLLDLWSKQFVFRKAQARLHLSTPAETIAAVKELGHVPLGVLIPGVIDVQASVNMGAAFGLGKGMAHLFLVFSLVASAVVIWIACKYAASSRLLTVALGLLLAGALGNAWDRALHGGIVRDFIDLHLAGWHYPAIFNIADVAICFGCGMIVLHSFRKPPAPAKNTLPPNKAKPGKRRRKR